MRNQQTRAIFRLYVTSPSLFCSKSIFILHQCQLSFCKIFCHFTFTACVPSRSFSARPPGRACEGLSAVAFAPPRQPHSITRLKAPQAMSCHRQIRRDGKTRVAVHNTKILSSIFSTSRHDYVKDVRKPKANCSFNPGAFFSWTRLDGASGEAWATLS